MKLANVLLRKDGHITIADYGLVHDFEDGIDYQLDHQGSPLTTGCCGTRTHMAPEVLEDKPYSYSSDWWSFGVCLFTMLQGEVCGHFIAVLELRADHLFLNSFLGVPKRLVGLEQVQHSAPSPFTLTSTLLPRRCP